MHIDVSSINVVCFSMVVQRSHPMDDPPQGRRQDHPGAVIMKIALFGAIGPLGRLVLQKALAGGHQVTANARDPYKLGALGAPGLTLVTGELIDVAAIEGCSAGEDAVISPIGLGGK
jgi:hypothetical protein